MKLKPTILTIIDEMPASAEPDVLKYLVDKMLRDKWGEADEPTKEVSQSLAGSTEPEAPLPI